MKNTFYSFLLITLFFYAGCSNKDVQLPTIELDGITEIQNHSNIWIFFDIKGSDTVAVLNKNNKILNTHWIFNIDRRLAMKTVVPQLQKMQESRNKDSMHKKEGMNNYFSFANTKSKNISLVKFDQTKFISDKKEYDTILEKYSKNQILEIDIQNESLSLNKKVMEIELLLEKINNVLSKDTLKPPKIILQYHENTNYHNYLKTKAYIQKHNIVIDINEYIYSVK
ncbi:MAG: hypothetical protein DRI95_12220 [Bacteroidetes bacterium]|nr:MAG: hypothetical protein DRI95_12220 [Bacteroidota bacterium]